jgi:hypothetical protein
MRVIAFATPAGQPGADALNVGIGSKEGHPALYVRSSFKSRRLIAILTSQLPAIGDIRWSNSNCTLLSHCQYSKGSTIADAGRSGVVAISERRTSHTRAGPPDFRLGLKPEVTASIRNVRLGQELRHECGVLAYPISAEKPHSMSQMRRAGGASLWAMRPRGGRRPVSTRCERPCALAEYGSAVRNFGENGLTGDFRRSGPWRSD